MNQKGFTLVELLAVLVILGLIMGIATYGVVGTINSSKRSSEKIFVDKLSNFIDDYLAENGSYLHFDVNEYYCVRNCSIHVYKSVDTVTLSDLVDASIVDKDKLVNPANGKSCLGGNDDKGPNIVIFKSDEFVYYYYVDLSGNNTYCEVSDDNNLLFKMPNDLIISLNSKGVFLPERLKQEAGIS